MGHLKDIANQPTTQSFPSSTYEIAGEVPATQCSEARIEGDDATTQGAPANTLTDTGNFVGWNLIGKRVTITKSTGGNLGTDNIIGNDNDELILLVGKGNGINVEYYVHNGGSLILTRNVQSFAQFIHNVLKPYAGSDGSVVIGQNTFTAPGRFPRDWTGLEITTNPAAPPDRGTWTILSNTLDALTVNHTWVATQNNVDWTADGPAGYAYTIKGAKLYTNTPTADLQKACTILFAPLT